MSLRWARSGPYAAFVDDVPSGQERFFKTSVAKFHATRTMAGSLGDLVVQD